VPFYLNAGRLAVVPAPPYNRRLIGSPALQLMGDGCAAASDLLFPIGTSREM
jgi:hypothetical protein